MRKIGIMGGTFNPIHVGHLMLAQWAMEENQLDEVWFIPTGCSYMKEGTEIVSPQERYQMTCLAVAGNDRMRCLDTETKREGYTYTYETLEQLKKEYPEDIFYFIFGADCLFTIESWRCPELIFQNCRIIAAVRGDTSLDCMESKKAELADKYQADIILMDFLNFEISSTQIRERICQGRSIRYLVPDNVIAYIEEKGFYRHEEK